jgi:hypothetical protein
MPEIKYGNAGQAGVWTDSFSQREILAGDTPQQVSAYGLLQAANVAAGIPAFTPVYVHPETLALTVASYAADDSGVEPNALTLGDIEAGTVAGSSVPVWTAGCYNIYAINWPASYDTEGKKLGAFARTMANQIVVKKPYNADA